VYATCLFCASHLGANRIVETFPVGRRLAFDAARGRLWVVCRHCERWNLTPLEERWEAVEDCERRFRDARKRVSTDNIGIAKLDEGLELVRIGEPLRPEFAAWRYGDQFGRRRTRTIIRGSAIGAAAAALAVGSIPLGGLALGTMALYRVADGVARRIRDNRVIARVPRDDGNSLTVLGQHLPFARLSTEAAGAAGWRLELTHAGGKDTMHGEHALHAAALIMPSINGTGANALQVQRAIRRLEAHADPVAFMRSTAAISSHPSRTGDAATLAGLPADMRLAVEMAANEENERYALEGEIALLEMAWEEAEEIAAIADDLVVSPEIERRLEELRRETSARQRGTR
jgi:hypothetical protein